MPFFLLQHSHDAQECAAAFAAWQGFESPLRHRRTPSTCLAGGHSPWCQVEALDRQRRSSCCPGSWPSGPRPSRSERCRSLERPVTGFPTAPLTWGTLRVATPAEGAPGDAPYVEHNCCVQRQSCGGGAHGGP